MPRIPPSTCASRELWGIARAGHPWPDGAQPASMRSGSQRAVLAERESSLPEIAAMLGIEQKAERQM